jgi:hypothetical protein
MVNPCRISMLAAVVVIGCGEAHEEWGGRVVEVDGVLRVENPSSLLGAPGTISAGLLWTSTGPAEGDPWEAPNWVHVEEGVVYVVDRLASKIHRLSLDGEPMGALGEPGEGPGQYRRIIDAIPTAAGLFVVDGGNGRVEVLDRAGDVLASGLLGQVVFSAVPLGENAIAVSGFLEKGPQWQRIDAAGKREPLDFPEFLDPDACEDTSSRASTWRDRPVRLRFTSPQIQVFSASGELEKVITVPLPPEEATDEEIEELVSEMASVLAGDGLPSALIQQRAEEIRSRPRAKFRFRDVRFDDSSELVAIWEQNPEDLGSGNATLHLLSLGGIYLGVLDLERAWSAFDLKNGVLYTLSRDPNTDLVTLEAFSISVPDHLQVRAEELASGSVQ